MDFAEISFCSNGTILRRIAGELLVTRFFPPFLALSNENIHMSLAQSTNCLVSLKDTTHMLGQMDFTLETPFLFVKSFLPTAEAFQSRYVVLLERLVAHISMHLNNTPYLVLELCRGRN